ncbi:MAG: glucans biosynthesis glucosyltransferase MdoH [Proteobacteria bacterium]|nr:glucans biosynthesis glucosyltransferase MdoH [Pseudomonadota bacterium]
MPIVTGMPSRRLFTALLALIAACLLALLLGQAIGPGGWTVAKTMMAVGFAGQAPWIGLGVANGTIGIVRLLSARAPSPRPPPARGGGEGSAIAIAVAVRNEAMPGIVAGLRRLLDGLAAAGQGERFAAFVLSDSDAAREAAEAAACAADPRIRYRRRASNEGFKAGNLMDFLDAGAGGCDCVLVLDADSEMTAAAVLRLADAMRDDPRLGIVQHLTVGLPAASPFPRLFQFGMRAGMRSWAAGQDWWQGDEGPFWGHNAMLRAAPFRDHARLPALPDGSTILSHDQVEAALLRAAGWGVRVLVEEDGSYEANPTTLPEFLRRDARWLAGNLQYRHLFGLPLRPMGRWQLLQAILLFTGPPFALLFLAGAAWAAAADAASPFPAGAVLALSIAWPAALFAPKLLSYAALLLSAPERRRYGGGARLAAGILAETVFTLLLEPLAAVSKTGALWRALTGRGADWPTQDRTARGVPWAEAARAFWPHTMIGVAALLAFAQAGTTALVWSLPFVGGLAAAIPFCVATASPRFGAWLARRGVAAVPEEIAARGAAPAVLGPEPEPAG